MGHRREMILNALTGVTATCALVLTVHTLRAGNGRTRDHSAALPSVSAMDLKPLLSSGHWIGPESARLTVVEFGDFQCPVCGAYEHVIDSMRSAHPRDFAVNFHQFPLTYHPLAYALARASECAAAQGRFTQFHDFVYANQNLLGSVAVATFGSRVGIADSANFAHCALSTTPVPEIDLDVEAGKRLGIPGTPTIIVNGKMHTADLSVKDLEALLANATPLASR